jgi:hypothetical protein
MSIVPYHVMFIIFNSPTTQTVSMNMQADQLIMHARGHGPQPGWAETLERDVSSSSRRCQGLIGVMTCGFSLVLTMRLETSTASKCFEAICMSHIECPIKTDIAATRYRTNSEQFHITSSWLRHRWGIKRINGPGSEPPARLRGAI